MRDNAKDLKYWTFIKVVETDTYYVFSFMKRNSSSYKIKYEGYLQLIYRFLLMTCILN